MTFNKGELAANVRLLPAWDADFEVPDVANFQDFVFAADPFAERLVRASRHPTAHDIALFPYPKLEGGLRQFAVLPAAALAIFRTAAGRVLPAIQQRLPSTVYSCRLAKSPPGWKLVNPKKAWGSMNERGIALLKTGELQALCVTDIASFYPSLLPELLYRTFLDLQWDLDAAVWLITALHHWNRVSPGLPVGPEASAVLSDGFLIPMDEDLVSAGITHHRFRDDVHIFGRDGIQCREALTPLDRTLTELHLTRSLRKTMFFDSPEEAIAYLRDKEISYASQRLRDKEEEGLDAACRMLEEMRSDPEAFSLRKYRWVLRTLTRRGDPAAFDWLVSDPAIANIEPKDTGNYFAQLISADIRGGARVFELLERLESRADLEALRLHLFRALSNGSWGNAEGQLIQRASMDRARPASVRAWAWQAAARTPVWRASAAVENAVETADPFVKRGALVSLKSSGRIDKPLLHLARDRLRGLDLTVQWLEAA